jgi:hypothetical protein
MMGMRQLGILALFGLAAVVGCSDKDDGRTGGGGGGIGDDGSGSGSGDGDGGDDGGGKWDIGGGTGTGNAGDDEEGEYCKIDFLFVIDSSLSMIDEQQNLITSFPGFIEAISTTLDSDDFHLMVIDAGQVLGADCDGVLGAGRTKNGAGVDCGFVGGNRYATEAQPDLAEAFACAGMRGSDGPGNEEAMQSMMQSIGPLNEVGQCNEGFLRDDAILVLTTITDEEDDPNDTAPNPQPDGSCVPADDDLNSPGDPQVWYDAVLTAKNDDPQAMVVLSLLGDCDQQDGICPGITFDLIDPNSITGAEPAPRLREWTNKFHHGSIGPVCAPDYAPFFEDAVSVIDIACDEFEPPG